MVPKDMPIIPNYSSVQRRLGTALSALALGSFIQQ